MLSASDFEVACAWDVSTTPRKLGYVAALRGRLRGAWEVIGVIVIESWRC